MTKDTEVEVKSKIYESKRQKAVHCLMAMGAKLKNPEQDPYSWESVMELLEYTFKHGSAAEKASGVLAASKWVWAQLECEAMHELCGVTDMVEREVKAAKEEPAGDQVPVSEEPAPAAKAATPAK